MNWSATLDARLSTLANLTAAEAAASLSSEFGVPISDDAVSSRRGRLRTAATAPGSLMAELRAEQAPVCRFCLWLSERPVAEREEWVEALADRSFGHSAIFRIAKRRGYMAGQGTIETHRKQAHS